MLSKLISVIGMMLGVGALFAQTVLPTQSSARPFGLDIVGPVYQAGSDAASADFQANFLQDFNTLGRNGITSPGFLGGIAALGGVQIDPARITLANDANVRTYFVTEHTREQNSLGVNDAGWGAISGNPELIFPLAQTRGNQIMSGDNSPTAQRNGNSPLLPGDFVDAGSRSAGSTLDFFLIRGGATGRNMEVFSSNPQVNSAGAAASVAFAIQGSPYIYLAFTDFEGNASSVLKFDDLVVAIDVGISNVSSLAAPEPATWVALFALLGVLILIKVRKERY